MIGAIAGDIIGSPYEGKFWWMAQRSTEFPLFSKKSRFTDDTVLTLCVCDYVMNGGNIVEMLKSYAKKYPVGYGPSFKSWVYSDSVNSYGSFGNGSAMRISSVPHLLLDYPEMIEKVREITKVTHDHPEGIRGTESVATAIHCAIKGKPKEWIKNVIENKFGYNLGFKIEDIRKDFVFDPSCQGTVPAAIISFLESKNYQDAVRLAVSLGGDTDTLACITGGIAGAYYGVPHYIHNKVLTYLDIDLRIVLDEFINVLVDRCS